jgi:hypothetical protein
VKSAVWDNVDYPITQPFGCTTVAEEPYWPACQFLHFHCGVDIGMNIGTPLYAARSGWVVNISYGLFAIQVLGGETDWYVHVDRAAEGIVLGWPVGEAQLVCYSGDKVPAGGASEGPHLHFETQGPHGAYINQPGTALNPIPILEGAMTRSEMVAVLRAYLRNASPANYNDPTLNHFGDIAVASGLDAAMVAMIATYPPVGDPDVIQPHTHALTINSTTGGVTP